MSYWYSTFYNIAKNLNTRLFVCMLVYQCTDQKIVGVKINKICFLEKNFIYKEIIFIKLNFEYI